MSDRPDMPPPIYKNGRLKTRADLNEAATDTASAEAAGQHERLVMREAIDVQRLKRQEADRQINIIAERVIHDFHFLSHQVSTFWDCDKSPIGKCVWDISERGFHHGVHCYYCGGPVERK